MTKTFYIFLDVDGVLNNETYTISCYERHHKSMHMNHVPFDPKCLNNLMILVQSLEKLGFEVKIILSSTWRLSNIDYEIVNARIAEYGLKLDGKTPHFGDRGAEIKEYLKDKEYVDLLILDDDSFDIIDYFYFNLINTNFKVGFNSEALERALRYVKERYVNE